MACPPLLPPIRTVIPLPTGTDARTHRPRLTCSLCPHQTPGPGRLRQTRYQVGPQVFVTLAVTRGNLDRQGRAPHRVSGLAQTLGSTGPNLSAMHPVAQ